ncbi:MFS general substrate transporter domain-containing protein [Dioscorea alata]|uniref:MFS general substrate transporter domain-containing protein n=1 Tax=Dioscorea alata TaxID=55571 RepID=A0ACB7W0P8_DIOAL|nr:MFS general substrate transporter domain-containing protein [Dioscorea alata]
MECSAAMLMNPFENFLLCFSTLATTTNGWISEELENKEEGFNEEPSSLRGISTTTSSIFNRIMVALIFFFFFFFSICYFLLLLFPFLLLYNTLLDFSLSLSSLEQLEMEVGTTLWLRLTLRRSTIMARDEGMKPDKQFLGRECILRKGSRRESQQQ